ASIYGDVPDLSALFYRIVDGVSHRGEHRVIFPDSVPVPLRPIILTCLEREPEDRFADARSVIAAVESALAELPDDTARTTQRRSLDYVFTRVTLTDEERFTTRAHPLISRDELERMDATLARHGYLVERALGRVKGHAIFLAVPDPELVAGGRF